LERLYQGLRIKTSMVWFKKIPKAAKMGQVATGAKMANVGGTCAEICTHIKFPKRNLPIESLINNASRPG